MGSNASGRRSKVERLLQKYELDGVGDELERFWTAEDSETRRSLRDLATYFNERLLERALQDTEAVVLEGSVERTYQLLTSENVSRGKRTQVERRLQREGIDIDELRADFVSYQAIRTYLKNYRRVERSTDDRNQRAKAAETVNRLRNRLVTVAETRLERLRSTGQITLGKFHLIANLRVVCEDCGAQREFTHFVDSGGCDCPK